MAKRNINSKTLKIKSKKIKSANIEVKKKASKKTKDKSNNMTKRKLTKSIKRKKKFKSHKEAIEEILKGIKEIEYASERKKIEEKEPHIEHILKTETSAENKKEEKREETASQLSFIPSQKEKKKAAKIEKEIRQISYSIPEKAIESLPSTFKKPKAHLEKPTLVKTGIPGFDEMCGGGIEEKSIILVNGDAGSGKTVFGLQFLYEGAKNNEAGLFISFGESRETIYSRMLSFDMNFQELEDRNLFIFLEYQPHEIAKIMQEEGGTLYDIITSYNIKRIVVDTITPYLMQFQDPYKARLALVRLFNVFKKFNVTTLLLNEWSSDFPSNPPTAVAEFLADGIVYIIHKRSPEGVQVRGIEIWKMTGVAHTEVARPFAFTNKGIVIYPNERLFFGSSQKKL